MLERASASTKSCSSNYISKKNFKGCFPFAKLTKSAFHLSELTGQARLFLNGTREFRELVPDRLVLLCV